MAKIITATVKFFNQEKGFGFMERSEGGDIFVHATIVEASGFVPKQMLENVEASFEYEANGDRRQVTKLLTLGGLKPRTVKSKSVKPVRRQSKQVKANKPEFQEVKVGSFHTARVKFFNQEKGFGFLVILDQEGMKDVFVHVSNIPEDLYPPQTGDVYDIRIEENRGRAQALVLQEHEGQYANLQVAA